MLALVRQWIPVHASVLFLRLVDFFFLRPLFLAVTCSVRLTSTWLGFFGRRLPELFPYALRQCCVPRFSGPPRSVCSGRGCVVFARQQLGVGNSLLDYAVFAAL